MKTTIEFKDGHSEVVDDAAPTIDPENGDATFIDAQCGVIGDDVPLEVIARIIFEPD